MADHAVTAHDTAAEITLGAAPYSDIELDDIHEPLPVGTLGATDAELDGPLVLPDRSLTPVGAHFSRGRVALVRDSMVATEPPSAAHLERWGDDLVDLALGAARPGALGLADLVRAARATAFAVVERSDFQSTIHQAQVALALGATGVIPLVDDLEPLRRHLHPELVAALDLDLDTVRTDDLAWAAASAAVRRAAWWRHDRLLTTDGDGWRLTERVLPSVSVLLSTNRPTYIAHALDRIAIQNHPDVEVVLALHGFTDDRAQAMLDERDLTGHVVEIDAGVPLGVALNTAARHSSGQLVTKWDDDDFYGPDHLVDVCLGLRYSGAEMVGKAPEFIHFTADDTTILRNHSGFESFSPVIAGGTITMPRVAFDDIGGFPPMPRAVDHYIKRAVLQADGSIYRMHGFGFALVRHADGHTWNPPEGELTSGAHRSWLGLPDLAGCGGPT